MLAFFHFLCFLCHTFQCFGLESPVADCMVSHTTLHILSYGFLEPENVLSATHTHFKEVLASV